MSGMAGPQTMWGESKSSNYKPGTPGLAGTQTSDRRKQALTVGARGTRLMLDDSGQQVTVGRKMLL